MLITTIEQLKATLTAFYKHKEGYKKILSIDTETTGLDPHTAKPLLISFAYKQAGVIFSYVVDVVFHGADIVFPLFRHILEDPSVLKLAHNATYDWKIFYHQGIFPRNMFCTMIAEQAIYPSSEPKKFGLKEVAARRLDIVLDKSIRTSFTSDVDTDVAGTFLFTPEQIHYAEQDAIVLLDIFHQQVQDIKERDTVESVKIDQSNIPAAALAEYIGVFVDTEELGDIEPELVALINSIDKAIQAYMFPYMSMALISDRGVEVINTSSPLQIKSALNLLGCDTKTGVEDLQKWEMKNTKRGRNKVIFPDFSLDVIDNEQARFAIEHFNSLDAYILRAFAVLNAARILLRTFVRGITERRNKVTKRNHPSFNILGARATGRFSSRDPNFQNIPQNGKLQNLGIQKSIRHCFKASEGKVLLISDFAGIELVILAALSKDQILIDQILKGDIHLYVTQEVLGYKDITSDNKKKQPHKAWRDASKTLSYGIAYGVSAPSVADQMNQRLAQHGFHATVEDGQAMIDGWYSLFPGVKQYLDMQARNAITSGVVKSAMGRRREWDTHFETKWQMFAAQREGMNATIQGTGADMFKIAVALLFDELYRKYTPKQACMIMFVHDEIVTECDKDIAEEVAALVKQCMEESIRRTLPILSEYIGVYEGTSVEVAISDKYDK